MKLILNVLVCAALLCGTLPAAAQKGKGVIKENLKVEFPTLLKAVKKSLSDLGCRVEVEKTEQGSDNLYRSNIRTEFYIVSTGVDTTKEFMEKLSCEADDCEKFPFIRGGEWVSGRVQYSIVLKEKDDETVDFLLKGELSGYEQWVTSKVHFWDSNGILERDFYNSIRVNAGLPALPPPPPPADN
jgi:hypothetical protein